MFCCGYSIAWFLQKLEMKWFWGEERSSLLLILSSYEPWCFMVQNGDSCWPHSKLHAQLLVPQWYNQMASRRWIFFTFSAQEDFEANFGVFCCWLWWTNWLRCMPFVLPVLVQELEFLRLGWAQLKLSLGRNSEGRCFWCFLLLVVVDRLVKVYALCSTCACARTRVRSSRLDATQTVLGEKFWRSMFLWHKLVQIAYSTSFLLIE
jgi:hypothetical protein